MKEVNIVSDGISYVIEGKKIYVSKPTINQNYRLIQENSIETIENQIKQNEEEIKENSKLIKEYSGKTLITLLGYTAIGALTGVIFKSIMPFDESVIIGYDIIAISTSVGLIAGGITSGLIEFLKRGFRKNNRILRMENQANRELLQRKKLSLNVSKIMDKTNVKSKDSVTYFKNDRKDTIKKLETIKEFYSKKAKSDIVIMGVTCGDDEILLQKTKKLRK